MEPAFFLVVVAFTLGQPDAGEAASREFIRQTRLDHMVDDYVQRMTDEETRKVVGDMFLVGKALVDRQVTLTWRFP